jgi:hypothetical protein
VRDQDPRFGRVADLVGDERAIGCRHFQAVDHHQGADRDFDTAPAEAQHFREVSIREHQRAGQLVVMFVERPPGDEDPDHRVSENYNSPGHATCP